MMKRSFLFSAACGLLASLAFTTPSQAGNVLATDLSYSNLTTAVTTVDVTYTSVSNALLTSTASDSLLALKYVGMGNFTQVAVTSITEIANNEVQVVFASGVNLISGYYKYSTNLPATGDLPSSGSSGVGASSAVYAGTVPEPSSMALLGIGMTSFLAFRRFFKRTAVA